jgi:hypothetical protein
VSRSGLLVDVAVSLVLALVTLASRWPYRARMLYNWDAVQFALALREFDIAKHQPHPPGYLLYVGLGRLVNATVGDPTLAYVTLAMVFSAATTVTVYWLARALYDRTTAGAAAALLAVSPLFWFYGSVGLTYAGEAFGATLMALLAYRALHGSVPHLYLGAVCLGLAGGSVSPCCSCCGSPPVVGRVRPGWARWLCLLARSSRGRCRSGSRPELSGGPAAYLAASRQLYASVVLPTSILGGDLDTTLRQARYLLESVAVGLGPLALALVALPVYVRRRGWRTEEWFLLAWIVLDLVYLGLIAAAGQPLGAVHFVKLLGAAALSVLILSITFCLAPQGGPLRGPG